MLVTSACQSDIGLVPKKNQDYIWISEEKGIYIVADGMGGHEDGEIASRLAAVTVGEAIAAGIKSLPVSAAEIKDLASEAIEKANQVVWNASGSAEQTRRMGATIVVAIISPPAAYILHAGDSRIYLIRDNALTRLTQDDSWVAQLVASGVISAEDAPKNKLAHVITKAIGQDTPVEATFATLTLIPGDCLLLCCDGLWNMVDDEHILQEALHAPDLQALVEALINAANTAGGKDNISVVAIKIS